MRCTPSGGRSISIGSNLGERRSNLQGAVDSLADTPEVWVTRSRRSTRPVRSTRPEGPRDYLNAVVLPTPRSRPAPLLERAHAIEDAYGRERGEERNAPRTLDVDLIVVGDRRADERGPPAAAPTGPRAGVRAGAVARPRARARSSPTPGPVAELVEKTGREGVRLREDIELELN